jgi:hypothetical protein
MSPANSFYVHLPSNNITGSNTNTLCKYITHLQQQINLEGSWEVALTEFSYTLSWYNVPHESTCSVFSFRAEVDKSPMFTQEYSAMSVRDTVELGESKYSTPLKDFQKEDGGNYHWTPPIRGYEGNSMIEDETLTKSTDCFLLYTFTIPPAFYTHEGLIKKINTDLFNEQQSDHNYFVTPSLELGADGIVSSLTGKWLNSGTMNQGRREDTFVNVYGDVAEFLGFYWDEDEELSRADSFKGKRYRIKSSRYPQPKTGRYSLFVYTDIIRGIHVGDSISNLLRMVDIPTDSKFGDQVSFRYEKPEYKRLASNQISSIQMYIKDDCGSDIPFEFGRTIVTLHFRKVK